MSLLKGDQIFISYKREDWDRVDLCVKEWRRRGYNLWVDEERIKAGEKWREELGEAIDSSKAFIAFFNYEYFYVSKVCPQELTRAQERKLTILPINIQPELTAARGDEALKSAAEQDAKLRQALVDYKLNELNYVALVKRSDTAPIINAIASELRAGGVRRSLPARARRFILPAVVLILIVLALLLRPPDPPGWFAAPGLVPGTQDGMTVYQVTTMGDRVYFAADAAGTLGVYSLDMSGGDPAAAPVTELATFPDLTPAADLVTTLETDCAGRLWMGLRRLGIFIDGIDGMDGLQTLGDLAARGSPNTNAAEFAFFAPLALAEDCAAGTDAPLYIGHGGGLLTVPAWTGQPAARGSNGFDQSTCGNEVFDLAQHGDTLWALQRVGSQSAATTCASETAAAALVRFDVTNGITGRALPEAGARGSLRDLALEANGNPVLLAEDAILTLDADSGGISGRISLPVGTYQHLVPVDGWMLLGSACPFDPACIPLHLIHPRWAEPLALAQTSFAGATVYDFAYSPAQRVIWFASQYGLGYFRL